MTTPRNAAPNLSPRAQLDKARLELFGAQLDALDDWSIQRMPDGTYDAIGPFCEWAVKQRALENAADNVRTATIEMLKHPEGSA